MKNNIILFLQNKIKFMRWLKYNFIFRDVSDPSGLLSSKFYIIELLYRKYIEVKNRYVLHTLEEQYI